MSQWRTRYLNNRDERGAYDYWGCVADYDNEMDAEARHAAHLDGECPGDCEWCEAEKQAEDEAGE